METITLGREQNSPKQKQIQSKNDAAQSIWNTIDNVIPQSIVGIDRGVAENLSFETGSESFYLIGGVPDLQQIPSQHNWWPNMSGCAPTSAANIMKYWSSHGYPQLTQNLTDEQILLDLRQRMSTSSSGTTLATNIGPGMQSYARNHGDSTGRSYYYNVSWSNYKTGISAGPNVITIVGSNYYGGDHSVTGVGWTEFSYNGSLVGHQYMEVHDNWPTTAMSVFVLFDTNKKYYQGLWFDQFSPY